MPHYYAASGTPIQLDEAKDAVGVRFDGARRTRHCAKTASRSDRSQRAPGRDDRRSPDSDASWCSATAARADAPVETVVNALADAARPRSLADDAGVRRTEVTAAAGCDRADSGVVQAAARPPPPVRKLLDGLGLTIVGQERIRPVAKDSGANVGAPGVAIARSGEPTGGGRRRRGLCRAELPGRGAQGRRQRPTAAGAVASGQHRPGERHRAQRRARARRVGNSSAAARLRSSSPSSMTGST